MELELRIATSLCHISVGFPTHALSSAFPTLLFSPNCFRKGQCLKSRPAGNRER